MTDPARQPNTLLRRLGLISSGLFLLLGIIFFLALIWGSSGAKPLQVISTLLGKDSSVAGTIIWQIRFPRAMLAALVGAALGLGGLVFFGVHAGKKLLFRSLAADREKRRRAIDGQREGIEEEIKKYDREKKELEEQIRDIRERLGLSGDESLDGVENELQNSREVLQRVSHLREEKEELARQREKLTREMKSLEELRERKSAETDELRRAWNSELTGMGLDPALDPTVAARLGDRVETVRAQINHLRGAEDRLTDVGPYRLPPPCIYLFPATVPSVRNNPNPRVNQLGDVGILDAMHRCFGGEDAEVNSVGVEVAHRGAETVRTTTITRGGVVRKTTDPTPIRRA